MSELSRPRILVVDDHQIIRAALIHALSVHGGTDVSQANSFRSATDLISQQSFTLIIVDQYLGDGEGINLAELALRRNPEVKLALFTFEASWAVIERARAHGFSLFISKETSLSTIMSALEVVVHSPGGMAIYAPSIPKVSALISPLTKSEIEVLSLLSQGLTAREISVIRFNSEATIKSHVAAILRKLGSRNRVEAIQKAREMSLISTS
jgi:DNA-binding NarL/FixJ family response regulator